MQTRRRKSLSNEWKADGRPPERVVLTLTLQLTTAWPSCFRVYLPGIPGNHTRGRTINAVLGENKAARGELENRRNVAVRWVTKKNLVFVHRKALDVLETLKIMCMCCRRKIMELGENSDSASIFEVFLDSIRKTEAALRSLFRALCRDQPKFSSENFSFLVKICFSASLRQAFSTHIFWALPTGSFCTASNSASIFGVFLETIFGIRIVRCLLVEYARGQRDCGIFPITNTLSHETANEELPC